MTLLHLIESKKATPTYLNELLERALRLGHTAIFGKLFHASRGHSQLTFAIDRKLLCMAVSLKNPHALVWISRSPINPDTFHEAIMQVWKLPDNWDAESLKMVGILVKPLLRPFDTSCTTQGRCLLYGLLEQAVREKNIEVIEAIIRSITEQEFLLWKFVGLGLDSGWSNAILAPILSAPLAKQRPWGAYGDDWVKYPISVAIQRKNKEIFSLILKWKGIANLTEVEELWALFHENCNEGKIIEILRERYANC
jgi:hypothetical protein